MRQTPNAGFLAVVLALLALTHFVDAQSSGAFDTIHAIGLTVDVGLLTTFDSLATNYAVGTPLTLAHAQGPSADVTLDFGDNTYAFTLGAPAGMINALSAMDRLTITGGTFTNVNACIVDGANVNEIKLIDTTFTTDIACLCTVPLVLDVNDKPIVCDRLLP
jgi:hypothetical protein